MVQHQVVVVRVVVVERLLTVAIDKVGAVGIVLQLFGPNVLGKGVHLAHLGTPAVQVQRPVLVEQWDHGRHGTRQVLNVEVHTCFVVADVAGHG